MKTLSFTHAGLSEVPREVFDHADTLEHLDLSGNQLTALPDEFLRLRALKRVFLSQNPFEVVPPVLGQLPALEMVGFKSCRLRHVPDDALPPRLRWLILTDNQLEALPESLGQRPRLQKLGLAGNRLRALPRSFAQATALELVRLSANAFEAFPAEVLELPRLAWLAFAGNPFSPRPAVEVPAIAWSQLQLHEVLGAGASGVISRATCRALGGEVAVKVFKGAVTSDGLPEDEVRATLLAGAHPHLVAPLGRVVDHPEGAQALVLALMPPRSQALGAPPDYASCTRDVLPTTLPFSAAQFERVARGVAAVGAHLHACGVSHGDLYAHNTRVDAEGHVLVSDFGAASLLPGLSPEVRAGVERLEVRAFGALVDDLLRAGGPASLVALREACWSPHPPPFSTLAG
jgi:hypothetical protein